MNRPSPAQVPRFSRFGSGAESTTPSPDPRRSALPPGSRLAEYKILSVLDQGSSGFKYLALDHGLQRRVVIEEYLPASLAQRGNGPAVIPSSDEHADAFAHGLECFIDQARLLARFDHPSLMRVYRFWEANRTAYLATPCYEGIRLGDLCQAMERPPDENWLHELLLPLLDALEVLHGAGCYHWDISPQNLLLLPDGWPVLLSYADSRGAQHDPAFAPIEQYAQSATLQRGPWSSLYSLAALAYYCIGGQPPIASTVRALDDQMEPLFQVVDRLGRSFPELNYSVAFVSTIERALNVRPEERPQSLDEFRRALLGSAGSQDAGVTRAAAGEAKEQESSSLLRSSPDETASPPPIAERRKEPTLRAAPEDEPPTWFVPSNAQAARTPEEDRGAGVAPEPDGFADLDDLRELLQAEPDGSRDERRRGQSGHDAGTARGRRVWLAGFATLTLCVLAATGWMLWSDYHDAKAEQRFLALTVEQPPAQPTDPRRGQPARLPAEPPPDTTSLAPFPSAPEPQPTSGTIPPSKAALDGLRLESQAPAENASPNAPTKASASADGTPRQSSPPGRVKNEPGNPRVQCGTRTQFSLYRCMKDVCESPKYYDHAECKHLRVMDEVRAYP